MPGEFEQPFPNADEPFPTPFIVRPDPIEDREEGQARVRGERWIQDLCGGQEPHDIGMILFQSGIGWSFVRTEDLPTLTGE